MPRKRNVPDANELAELLDEMMEPVLPPSEVELIEQALDLSPEEFQKVTGRAYRVALIEGLKTMPRPKNIKEVAAMHKLFREAEGLDKHKDQGVVPQGFVPNMRTVSRRTIEVAPATIDAVATTDATPVDLDDFEV